jgi:hypothetical protein
LFFHVFSISLTSLCQMANTRNRNVIADNANNGEASNAENLTPCLRQHWNMF